MVVIKLLFKYDAHNGAIFVSIHVVFTRIPTKETIDISVVYYTLFYMGGYCSLLFIQCELNNNGNLNEANTILSLNTGIKLNY